MNDFKNYKLEFKPDMKVVISLEHYCPKVRLDITLGALYPGQIDGRAWTEAEIEGATRQMVNDVMEEIRVGVEAFIKEAAPYKCYGK